MADGVADPVDEGHRVFSRLRLLELVDVSHELENAVMIMIFVDK